MSEQDGLKTEMAGVVRCKATCHFRRLALVVCFQMPPPRISIVASRCADCTEYRENACQERPFPESAQLGVPRLPGLCGIRSVGNARTHDRRGWTRGASKPANLPFNANILTTTLGVRTCADPPRRTRHQSGREDQCQARLPNDLKASTQLEEATPLAA